MSQYIFEGRIRALVCDHCWDAVGGSQVILYRHRTDQNLDELVAARSKHTFSVLSEDAVEAKESSVIARATTDADGSFRIEIGDEVDYDGGPFEVDVRLDGVPGANGGTHESVQLTLASVQPAWRQGDDVMVADPWHHMISARFWCAILARYDVWVVCGRVVSTGTQTGLQGMKVRAFDRDWLQDDLL